MTDKVTLYIAKHNETGLKYLGKTERFFTEKDLQKYYHGSGVGWSEHLLEYGDDVTMKIYGIYTLDEVESVALSLSKELNIVESYLWANRMPEDGLNGWPKGQSKSDSTKRKIPNTMKGRTISEEHREKLSEYRTGKKHSKETIIKIASTKKGSELNEIELYNLFNKEPFIPKTKAEISENISKAKMGHKHSDETKDKMSKTALNRTEEHKNKISKAMKGKK